MPGSAPETEVNPVKRLLEIRPDSSIAMVFHDAGSTNIALGWLTEVPRGRIRPLMRGPAAGLWSLHFPEISTFSSLGDVFEGASAVISGTGWASDLEHSARVQAGREGILSLAVLDHWTHYPERFVRDGSSALPDEFWVTDVHALAEARRCFPDASIRMCTNPYLAHQVQRVTDAGDGDPMEVLYLLEPARSDWGREEPGEFQALDYFAANMHVLGIPHSARLRLRPHPSDPPGKYHCWMERNPQVSPQLDDSPTLGDAIGRAHWVAGCESYAMIVALLAGRAVSSSLPPWAPACRLPHTGIVHLKNMV